MLASRPLSILAILAVLAAGAALWLSASRAPDDAMPAAGPLLPELSSRINDVDAVVISSAGERIITLDKDADGWVMPERDGYAVDISALRKLLLDISTARRIEAKTANPERYAKLAVADPLVDDAASGVRVDISAAGESMGVIVGSNRQGGTGTYVRLVDEAQSWLTDRNIAVERRPSRWLQRQLSDIPASRIQAATVEHPAQGDIKAENVTIEADGKSGFTLVNLPKGRELADSYSTEALAGFLADLRFDELATVASKPVPEAGVGSAEFRSTDGIVIGLRYWTEGEQPQRFWAAFSVDFDAAQAEQGIDAAQALARVAYEAAVAKAKTDAADETAANAEDGEAVSDAASAVADEVALPDPPLAVTDADQDRQARLAAVQTEVDGLRSRFEGRVFELPTFKASNLRKRLDAYLKPAGS